MDTTFCENCHNDVPKESWDLHEASCKRHRYYCKSCKQTLLINERDQHDQEYHAIILCECGEEIEARSLTEHLEKYCGKRIMPCIYCKYPLEFHMLPEHEEVCGSRTDTCELCGQRMMLRDQNSHLCEEPVPRAPAEEYPQPPALDADADVGDELAICPFCFSPIQDYMLLQEHIFSDHPEIVN